MFCIYRIILVQPVRLLILIQFKMLNLSALYSIPYYPDMNFQTTIRKKCLKIHSEWMISNDLEYKPFNSPIWNL
jgi:hypothetical protein